MAKRNPKIYTSDRELYNKLNMLKFTSEVVIDNKKQFQINKIINNINKKDKILSTKLIGEYILVKKINPAVFNVYYSKTPSITKNKGSK